MHVAGCRREVVYNNTLRSGQLPAIRHHILRRRTAADEDANNQDAQSPDRDGTNLPCFGETISHKNTSSAKRPTMAGYAKRQKSIRTAPKYVRSLSVRGKAISRLRVFRFAPRTVGASRRERPRIFPTAATKGCA